jgi:hypothetical protein
MNLSHWFFSGGLLLKRYANVISMLTKLWRLLDVASTDEPARSEQRANLRKELSPRQLGGVVVGEGDILDA